MLTSRSCRAWRLKLHGINKRCIDRSITYSSRVKSSNEVTPGVEELGDAVDRYEGFYNESLGSQFSGFLDHTISQGQRVRLENFASAE